MGVGILAVLAAEFPVVFHGNELKENEVERRAWPTKALNDERVDGLDSPIARQFQVHVARRIS